MWITVKRKNNLKNYFFFLLAYFLIDGGRKPIKEMIIVPIKVTTKM